MNILFHGPFWSTKSVVTDPPSPIDIMVKEGFDQLPVITATGSTVPFKKFCHNSPTVPLNKLYHKSPTFPLSKFYKKSHTVPLNKFNPKSYTFP